MGKRRPNWVKEVAKQRMDELMQQAEENKIVHPERSRRYCELTLKLSQKYKVPLGEYKHKFCSNCFTYFTAENSKKRKIPKTSLFQITCLHCGKKIKVGVTKKPAQKRKKIKAKSVSNEKKD